MPTISGSSASYTANGWRVLTNVWNPQGLVYGTDYTTAADYNASNPPQGTKFTWTFPARTETNYYNVHAYPELIFGDSPWSGGTNPTDPKQTFPILLSDLSSFTADYNFSATGDQGGYNIAFELWLTDTPGGTSNSMTNEVMVWVHRGAFSPGGSSIGSYSDPYFTGTVYNATNWNAGTGAQGWTYTATATDADALSGKIDFGAILQNLINLGIASPSTYIADIELGAEVATSPGSLTVNSLDYNLQTKSGKSYVIGGIAAGTGTNTLTGGPGVQTAVFSGPISSYTITRDGAHATVSGAGVSDTLVGIEKAAFDDQTVILGQGPSSTDFNGDLSSDILWQNDSGQAAIWTMNGLSQIGGSPVGGNPGPSWHVKGAGDFAGDGHSDIVWQNDDGTVAIWTMNGLQQTGSAIVGSNPGSSWHIKDVADFNGDGHADILWQSDNGQAAIWLMNGTTVVTGSSVGGNPGQSWHVKGAGDFNGDGKADILWQNDSGQAAIWLMDGLNQIGASPVGGNPGPTWHVIGAGDFSGNGKDGILWQNDAGQIAIWTMDGLTQLGSDFVGGNPGPSWHAAGLGDFNGDGKADILWQNSSGQAAVWTMNGVHQLGGSPIGGNPGTTWHIATGIG